MSYTTIQALFTGICDAIRAKDGTTATINHQDIPTRISAIESGGSGLTGIAMGTFVLQADQQIVNINHNLGSIPTKIVIFAESFTNSMTVNATYTSQINYATNAFQLINNNASCPQNAFSDITSTTFTCNCNSEARPFRTGITYRWVVIA